MGYNTPGNGQKGIDYLCIARTFGIEGHLAAFISGGAGGGFKAL